MYTCQFRAMQISQQSGRSREELEAEVHALLEEMGHKFFMPALRVLAFVIRKGLRHISKGIYINKEGVDMVGRRVMRCRYCIQHL